MSERQGIEIDYCPKCRGVWLDRGELDKFIQQSEMRRETYWTEARHQDDKFSRSREGQPTRVDSDYRENRHYRNDDDAGYARKGKKRESFFGDLFDFD
jgi:Zn-finger nucleic acid-binding protein